MTAPETTPPAASVPMTPDLQIALNGMLGQDAVSQYSCFSPSGKTVAAYRAARAQAASAKGEAQSPTRRERIEAWINDSRPHCGCYYESDARWLYAELRRVESKLAPEVDPEAYRWTMPKLLARMNEYERRIKSLEESRPAPAASGPGLDEETARRVLIIIQAWRQWRETGGEDSEQGAAKEIASFETAWPCPFDPVAIRYILTGRIEPAAPEGER